jgi:putative flippase GtrA
VTGLRFRAERFRALIRFALGGVLSSTIAVTTAAVLHEVVAVPERVAGACGFAAALVVNFFVLRHYVFAVAHVPARQQLPKFLATTGLLRAIEFLAFYVAHRHLHLNYLLLMIMILGSSFLLKFLIYEGMVFAKRSRHD